jgi:hypothetical protein
MEGICVTFGEKLIDQAEKHIQSNRVLQVEPVDEVNNNVLLTETDTKVDKAIVHVQMP